MSVINQMLKDLDRRNNRADQRAKTILPRAYLIPDNNNYRLIVISVTVVFCILLTGYYFKFVANTETSETQIKLAAEIVPVTATAIATKENVVLSAEIEPEIKDTDNVVQSIQIEPLPIVSKATQPVPEATIIESPRVVKSHRQLDKGAEAERLYKSARQNLDANQIAATTQLLGQALDISPDFHKARVLLFSILLQQQLTADLGLQLEQSLQQWPDVHEYRLMKARLLVQQALNSEALELLVTDIPAVLEAPEYHALIAYVAQQTLQDPLAIEHYQLLLQHYPNRADWWLGLAVSEERQANKEAALQAYRQAIAKPGLTQNVSDYARQRIKILQGF